MQTPLALVANLININKIMRAVSEFYSLAAFELKGGF